MKLTLVVQRYGPQIVGGAERLCRGVAEGLARRHEVEVLTTCALSYRTWANEYREGSEQIGGVAVKRFRTEHERDIETFNAASEALFRGPHTDDDEIAWIEQQGPYAPALVDHLHAIADDRDLLVFFTYLYHPTVHGIHAAPRRSILVPTAHDEPPLSLRAYRSVFHLPAGLIFNTRAEQELVRRRFPDASRRSRVIGAGIEGLDTLEAARAAAQALPGAAPTLLFAGRIEEGKGVGELLDHVRAFRRHTGIDARLQLMGEQAMELPQDPWIEPLGFVSEQEKARRLAQATVLLAPSSLESFGIVLLEALAAGTPVLANAASEAYREHCVASQGGLCYRDGGEFTEALRLLVGDARLRRAMAAHGARYVRERYSWQGVVQQYEQFLSTFA